MHYLLEKCWFSLDLGRLFNLIVFRVRFTGFFLIYAVFLNENFTINRFFCANWIYQFFEKWIVWKLLNFEVICSLFNTEENQTLIIPKSLFPFLDFSLHSPSLHFPSSIFPHHSPSFYFLPRIFPLHSPSLYFPSSIFSLIPQLYFPSFIFPIIPQRCCSLPGGLFDQALRHEILSSLCLS